MLYWLIHDSLRKLILICLFMIQFSSLLLIALVVLLAVGVRFPCVFALGLRGITGEISFDGVEIAVVNEDVEPSSSTP